MHEYRCMKRQPEREREMKMLIEKTTAAKTQYFFFFWNEVIIAHELLHKNSFNIIFNANFMLLSMYKRFFFSVCLDD